MTRFNIPLPAGLGVHHGIDGKPCAVCGQECEHCICEECPSCGHIGRLRCYMPAGVGDGHMRLDAEQVESRKITMGSRL